MFLEKALGHSNFDNMDAMKEYIKKAYKALGGTKYEV
jgi:hypothetical protein